MAGRPSFAELAQKFARQRASQFAAGGGGGPRPSGSGGKPPNLGALLGGTGGLVLLAAGGLAINASLFNGECLDDFAHHLPILDLLLQIETDAVNLRRAQLMVVTEQSNTLGYTVSRMKCLPKVLISP